MKIKDININVSDNYGNNSLMFSCMNCIESIALKLLERQDININQIDNNNDLVLIYTCIYKMEKVALKLLEREDIKINYTYIGKSALDMWLKII